jgi:prepilin-type N-terminal cleavage/methylation domain-containing protein
LKYSKNEITLPPPKGFTLSELLIAVAVLGTIALFTIPKVLQTVETQTNKTKFKDTITTINQIAQYGASLTTHSTSSRDRAIIRQMLNRFKECPGSTAMCGLPNPHAISAGDIPTTGYILDQDIYILDQMRYNSYTPNTTYWAPLTVTSTNWDIMIDVNGAKGPDTIGVDRLQVVACLDFEPCGGNSWFIKPGTVTARQPGTPWGSNNGLSASEGAANWALWTSLWQ